MPKVKVNDIQIYYEVHGEGFPLIMIMGLSGSTDWWESSLDCRAFNARAGLHHKQSRLAKLEFDGYLWSYFK